MSDSVLWINKYKPLSSNQIIGHNNEKKIINDWLKQFNATNNNPQSKDTLKHSSIIITGNHGIGKTLTIKILLEENGYIVRIINPNEIKNFRIINDFSDYYDQNNSILSKLNYYKDKNNKIAIIFDETENISLTTERKYIMDIYKENNKTKSFPLIFISNNQHSKLLTDLKKYCNEIKFFSPSSIEIKKLIIHILNNENIKITHDDDIFNKIIEFSQFDISRLINILQELSYHYKNINSIEQLNYFFDNSKKKDINIGLFDASDKILNSYLNHDEIFKLYETEKVLLPLMVHEHYLKKMLTKNDKPWDSVINALAKVSDSISIGDNIETSIYTDQNWYLQNIHGFYTCMNTSYHINNCNSHNMSMNKMKFSSDLNKTSLKNINKKNINNLLKIVPNKSIDEIIYINQYANYLFKNGMIDKLLETLQTYKKDITVKEIELFLKIDKTQDFITLSGKERKHLAKKYNINIDTK